MTKDQLILKEALKLVETYTEFEKTREDFWPIGGHMPIHEGLKALRNIVNEPEVKEPVRDDDFQAAIDVQNAVNLGGVIHSFDRIVNRLQNMKKGTDWVNSHPICKLFATQIEHLTSKTDYMKSHEHCEIEARRKVA